MLTRLLSTRHWSDRVRKEKGQEPLAWREVVFDRQHQRTKCSVVIISSENSKLCMRVFCQPVIGLLEDYKTGFLI